MTRTVTLAGFTLIAVAAVALELSARRHDRATLADTIAQVPRLVTLAAWLWLGWHLFARASW